MGWRTVTDYRAPSGSVVDTNGAGDMYSGAFLYGITNGMGFEEAGALASVASATVVTQYGPRLGPKAHKQLLSLS